MIKQDWTEKRSGYQQTTTDSSVGRAEDGRKVDMLKSLVRVRVGGWNHLLFEITIAGNFYTVQNWNYVGKSNIVRI